MNMKVTKESIEAAKRVFFEKLGRIRGVPIGRDLYAAINGYTDALFIPEDTEWVKGDKPTNPMWLLYFDKANYRLIRWEEYWMLYLWNRKFDHIINCIGTNVNKRCLLDPIEAQAWADKEIEKLEASPCKQPTPPGPGPRYRAENGDELVTIKDQYPFFYAINITTCELMRITPDLAYGFKNFDELHRALIATGAVKEEGNDETQL